MVSLIQRKTIGQAARGRRAARWPLATTLLAAVFVTDGELYDLDAVKAHSQQLARDIAALQAVIMQGLRKELDLYANLRPARCFPMLVDASPLKPSVVAGTDIMVIRELTGGLYFGEPRGVEVLADGKARGVNTMVYTTREIERVVRENRLTTVEQVTNYCKAGGGCRGCHGEIEKIIEQVQGERVREQMLPRKPLPKPEPRRDREQRRDERTPSTTQ